MQNIRQLPGPGVHLSWDRPAINEWTSLFPVDWESPPLPFTAHFANAPSSHNGNRRFWVDLNFSEEFRVSWRRIKNRALAIEGGNINRVRRRVRGSNREWRVRIRPTGSGAVTLTLAGNRPCTVAGALCTRDGRQLAETVTVSVSGP